MHNHVLPNRLHPAVLAAALSVTAFSFVGIGAMTGLIHGPWKAEPVQAALAPAPATAVAAPVATAPSPAAAPVQSVPVVIRPVTAAPAPAAAEGHYSTRHAYRDANLHRVADREATAQDDPPIEVIRRAPADARQVPSAYGTPPPANLPVAAPAPPANQPPPVCRDCGTVESVREVKNAGEGSGIGAVAGGVLGGILGNQVGNGRGRNLATLAGIVGGAFAGNQVEKSQKATVRYEATVRFDDGSTRSFTQDMPWSWHSGDRVRLSNGMLAAGA